MIKGCCTEKSWESYVQRVSSDITTSYGKVSQLIEDWQQNVFKESAASLIKAGELEPVLKAEAILFLNMLETALLLLKAHLDEPNLPLEHQIPAILREISRDQFLFERTSALQSKMQSIWQNAADQNNETTGSNKPILRPRLEMLDIGDTSSTNNRTGSAGIYKPPKTFAMPFTKGDDEKKASMSERADRLKRSEFVRAVTEKYSDAPLMIGDENDAMAEIRGIKRSDVKKLKAIQAGSAKVKSFTSSTLKNLKKIPELTRLATVGSTLDNMSSFVDTINLGRRDGGGGGKRKRLDEKKKRVSKSSHTKKHR